MAYYPPTDWELKDFYREHIDSLYRSCCFLTCGQGDAQKMSEQILLLLLKKGMIFSSDKDARAWMLLKAYKMSRKPPKPILVEQALEQVTDSSQECIEVNNTKPECPEVEVPNNGEEDSPEEENDKTDAARCDDGDESAISAADDEVSNPVSDDIKNEINTVFFQEELRKLSRKDRLIALLYYCESYRKAEIANYLGWPTFRVNNRLVRIKKRILSEKGAAETC